MVVLHLGTLARLGPAVEFLLELLVGSLWFLSHGFVGTPAQRSDIRGRSHATPAAFLCYICHPHGTRPAGGAAAGPSTLRSLLSTVQPGGHRSAHVWRLFCSHLPALWHAP